jgi:acylpyruvate hydrolase
VSNVDNLTLKLYVNGLVKQNGNTKDMIFKIPKLVSFISDYITLENGDIILTGTPAGVGPVKTGDLIEAELFENEKILSKIKFTVGENR